jgi:hypothetical protein
VHFTKTALADDFSDLVLVQNCTVVELFSVQCNVENISILDKLHVLVEYFEPVPVEQLSASSFFFLVKAPTGFFYYVRQPNAISVLDVYLQFLL